jgi:hypothetical protein
MDKFGSWAKLREIVRVLTKHHFDGARSLVAKLLVDAAKDRSISPFRRPVANDDGETSYPVLEYDTVLAHVRFAEKLGIAIYRDPAEDYLPGLEPRAFEFSESAVDARIVSFLAERGISLGVLESAIEAIEFHDVDSIVEVLREERKLPLSVEEFRKCLRLLGECGVSVKASRKKTYAVRARSR